MIDHWRGLADFARYEIAAGGPDPHMRYVAWCARNEPWEERVWRCGVYAAGVYNFASAEAIWLHWPWRKARADPDGLTAWLATNWKGLRLRRERRAIRTPSKLAVTLAAYAVWAEGLPARVAQLPDDPEDAYEELWEYAQTIPGVGRYSGFKLLEVLTRAAELPISMPDLRPRGGFSPRLTLAALYPSEAAAVAPYDDHREPCDVSNRLAEDCRRRLAEDFGVPLDRYCMEVMLCDFRQSYDGLRQYPGRSNDSELAYWTAIAPWWAGMIDTELFDARAALTPAWARGEDDDAWLDVRADLGPVFVRHGYTWSDLLYDYRASVDLAAPVRRNDAAPSPDRAPGPA